MSAAGTTTNGSARHHVHDNNVAQPASVGAEGLVATPDAAGNSSGAQVAQTAPAPGPYSTQQDSQLQQAQHAQLAENNATSSKQRTEKSSDAAAAPVSESQEPVEADEQVEEHPVRHVPWPKGSGVQLDTVPAGYIS